MSEQEAVQAPSVTKSKGIRISNPPPGHHGWIGERHAARWVKQGRAFWATGGVLVLFDKHRKALARSRSNRVYVEGCGYDEVQRPLTQSEMRHLPLLPAR